ncbi:MAG: oligosaccharide flippase family protein [Wenzhouxiangellaceae bacterium]|nr:oligosaccharide flippase family protein [Wenzhouxiangellaceae bacterium]
MSPDAGDAGTGGNRAGSNRTGGNFFRLLRGRGMAALLMLAAMSLMARALPPAEFGLVILLHSFALGARGLVNVKPFEAIVLYGTRHAARPRYTEQLLRLMLLVDVATVVAAFALAWFAAGWLAGWLEWSAAERALARGYSVVILTSMSGTASGVLRLYDRFDVIARQRVVQGVVMLAGAAAVSALGGGLVAFVVVQGLAFAAHNIYLQRQGWREFARRHPDARLAGPVFAGRRRRFPGLGRFLAVTYWQGNLDLFPKHLVVLGAGALLGETAAGLYRLAAQTTRVISVPALLLRQVLFPDLARLWRAAPDEFHRLVRRALAGSAASAAVLVGAATWFGDELIAALFGERYAAGAVVLVWLMLAAALELVTAVLRAALYARARAGKVLIGYAAGVALHAAAFAPLALAAGLEGTGMAAAFGALLTLGLVSMNSVRPRLRE